MGQEWAACQKGKAEWVSLLLQKEWSWHKSHFILDVSYGEGKEDIQGARATFQVFTSLPILMLSSHSKD